MATGIVKIDWLHHDGAQREIGERIELDAKQLQALVDLGAVDAAPEADTGPDAGADTDPDSDPDTVPDSVRPAAAGKRTKG